MKLGNAAFLAFGIVLWIDVSLMAQPKGARRGEPQPGNYGWLSSLQEGKAQARKTGKPLMVVLRCVP